ncbi:hypothetical protein ES703_72827 [subsurface metagenome]
MAIVAPVTPAIVSQRRNEPSISIGECVTGPPMIVLSEEVNHPVIASTAPEIRPATGSMTYFFIASKIHSPTPLKKSNALRSPSRMNEPKVASPSHIALATASNAPAIRPSPDVTLSEIQSNETLSAFTVRSLTVMSQSHTTETADVAAFQIAEATPASTSPMLRIVSKTRNTNDSVASITKRIGVRSRSMPGLAIVLQNHRRASLVDSPRMVFHGSNGSSSKVGLPNISSHAHLRACLIGSVQPCRVSLLPSQYSAISMRSWISGIG